MSVSHKYRTFDQLYEDVTIDFSTYALEGMIEPQQLIKVATRVNYDLGLRIHRTKEVVLDMYLHQVNLDHVKIQNVEMYVLLKHVKAKININ